MSIGIKGNADGSGAIQVGGTDAITVSTSLNTTFAGTVTSTGTVTAATGTLYPVVSGTAVASTSGTSIDFTSIPSWVKRITVMFNGVSTNGTNNLLLQIGSGSVDTSGYTSRSQTTGSSATSTSGFILTVAFATSADTFNGTAVINLLGSNIWTQFGLINHTGQNVLPYSAGIKSALSGALDRVRITTVGGTDTFDAGSINIQYE